MSRSEMHSEFKSVTYSPLNDGPESEKGGGISKSSRNASTYDLKGCSQGGPGRAVYRPKKSRAIRWLVLHMNGDKQILTLEKRYLVQTFNLDVPSRDLRLLDSHFSNYETIGQISVRDNTIVFSMEHVKALIMADKVIVPLEEEQSEAKERFVLFLEQMLQERAAENVSGGGSDCFDFQRLFHNDNEVLTFELHVLEAALGEVCNHLAREVDFLQAQAQPALEDLAKDADQPTLERVRRIKTGHQRLIVRTKLVREVLERLMEDDGDMLRMCLTRQSLRRVGTSTGALANLTPAASLGANMAGTPNTPPFQGIGDPDVERNVPPFNLGATSAVLNSGNSTQFENMLGSPAPMMRQHPSLLSMRRHGVAVASQEALDSEEAHDLLDVENLLESYFMLVDSTHQSLISIGEYIDDTEDLINIQLDYSRNKLIRFDIILTTGTFSIAIFSAVAGALGENLALPEVITMNFWGFALINVGVVLLCAATFWVILRVLVRSKII